MTTATRAPTADPSSTPSPPSRFWAGSLASLPETERERILRRLSLTELQRLWHSWEFWARDNQLEPAGDWWTYWLLLAGRGFGKTRSGAEWVHHRVDQGSRRVIIAGPTANDIREAMIEGESGLVATAKPWNPVDYEPSKLRVTWKSGARAVLISDENPERFRNKQCDTFWLDELAAWTHLKDSWDQLQFTFRLRPPAKFMRLRGVITTTPKPKKLLKELIARARTDVAITKGSTYDNRANLSEEFYQKVVAPYEGTRIGRQELLAELLDDVEGALWSRQMIDDLRVERAPALRRVVVAVDPATTDSENSDETGIVVVGRGHDGHGYVLEDLSGRHSPLTWARLVVGAQERWGADRIVAEANNGGKLVEVNIRTVSARAPVRLVHASRGKHARAEPVAALYERRQFHHVGGRLAELEDQMTSWEPLGSAGSPDRLDALVWGATELMLQPVTRYGIPLSEPV